MPDTTWDPVKYNQVADFVAKLGEPLLTLLAPSASDHVLDLGCGEGKLTKKIQARCHHVIGIDASPEMVAAAKNQGIEAYVRDAHQLNYQNQFDSVVSNAALHWMKSPEKVVKGIFEALKPNGVLVAEFGGFGNAAKIVDALSLALTKCDIEFTNPWYFPTPKAYAELLRKQGFDVQHIELFDRLTPLPQPLSEWILTFGQSFFKHAAQDQISSIIEEVVQQLKADLLINGTWHVDYVRLRVKALKL